MSSHHFSTPCTAFLPLPNFSVNLMTPPQNGTPQLSKSVCRVPRTNLLLHTTFRRITHPQHPSSHYTIIVARCAVHNCHVSSFAKMKNAQNSRACDDILYYLFACFSAMILAAELTHIAYLSVYVCCAALHIVFVGRFGGGGGGGWSVVFCRTLKWLKILIPRE